MRKLFFPALAILAIAAMVFPAAAASGEAEVRDGQYHLESLNTCQNGPYLSGHTTSYSPGQKLVCLTFDDGWKNQYDNALPVLQMHGFKATFAVVTTWIGQGTGTGQAMSYTELHALADQGMDIASHTRTHPHLPALGAGDLQDEVANSKLELETEGFTVRTLVYPYYEYNSDVVTSTKNAGYICARSGARDDPYDPADRTDPDSQYYIDAIEINTQDLNIFKGIVDVATDRSVICLCYHSISDAGRPTPCTPVANFAEQMQYLKDSGFTVALLPDLVQSPSIVCSPAGLTFSGMQGGDNPATQALNISNSGGGTLNWTASSDATWLTLIPTGGAAPSTVTVTADITGLSAGAYNGAITITATGATNTPQTVPVTLTVQTASSGWLTGWSCRKQITIAGSSAGAQTDYPMKLTVNRSTGVDSGATVYLGTGCSGDYRDIRFTTYDGSTLLDYWIESSTGSSATVWVEFDSIPASPGTANFNLYYGNSGATSASNIQNTFTFADDFDDGSLDAARWTTGGGSGGTVSEADGLLTVTAGSANQKYAASINTYGNAYALHARAKLDSITGCSSYRLIGFVTTRGSYADKLYTTAHRWFHSGANFVAVSGDGSGAAQADMLVAADTVYHVSECRRYAVSGTNYDRFIIDGGAAVNGAKPTATARYIYINSDEYGKAIVLDWIFLRKFVSPEPAWSAWGSEETSGSPPPSPTIAVSPAGLTFSGIQGGSNPPTQALDIASSGGGTLSWTASSDVTWLTLAPSDGASPGTVTVTADTNGLSAGVYNGSITVASADAVNSPQAVPVTLTIESQPPTIAFDPSGLTFSGIQGGSVPPTQALDISNSGGGTLNWTASSGAAWLTLSPADGTAPTTVTVSVDITGLSAGVYDGAITVDATGASNTPQVVPVTLTIACVKPGAPTLSSPAGGATVAGTTVTFQWNQVSGATKYWLEVNSSSSWGLSARKYYANVGNVLSKSVGSLPNNGSTLYWRVWAGNSCGWCSDAEANANRCSFINGGCIKPGAPILSSPAGGATVAGTTVTFQWNQVSGATKYWLEVNSSSSWDLSARKYYANVGNVLSKSVGGLPNNGSTLYWRAWAGNSCGWCSDAEANANRCSFVSGTACIRPGAPTLSSPANGATITGKSGTFTWAAGTGSPTKYWLEINSSSSWGSATRIYYANVGNVTSKTVSVLPANGSTLYWRVEAYNACGWGAWSGTRNFINGP